VLVLITYDVSTETSGGKKRLRQVAKTCLNYGQRVQNSVFECSIEYGTFLKLKKELEKIIEKDKDSLRYYNLGNNWDSRVEHIGAKPGYNPEGVLII
jgi:CRISPR-associated protein Cas2